jgi:hypothetical protein
MKRGILTIVVVAAAVVSLSAQGSRPAPKPAGSTPANAPKSPGAGPVFVVETMKGTFEVETYPNEAPKTVDHILALIKRNFYNGQRILRIVPNQSPAEKRAANERAAAAKLREYKRFRGVSAERLASEFGYSPDAVERWLSGKARVPGGVIVAIHREAIAAGRKAA